MLWTAVVFAFILGAAALAVDASGAFGAARADQATADLACLAGVKELPDQTAAFNTAASYIDANWDLMSAPTLTIAGAMATYTDGSGNSVSMEAAYGGAADQMHVEITEVMPTSFAGALGKNTVTVTQEAACAGKSIRDGAGLLPIGALSGPWTGDLFDCAAKITGNCGAVAPDSPGANAYRDAVANGIPGSFIKHHGDEDLLDPETGEATIDCLATPCNVTETETGNMVGPWNQGLELRFTGSGIFCNDGDNFNCDTIGQVFGGDLENLSTLGDDASPPMWWKEGLWGTWVEARNNTNTNHYWYDGATMQCLSARIATIPIINQDLDWDVGDGTGTWPNGTKDMKMIGFYTVFIREPSELADVGGTMEADIVWFGSNAECADTKEAFRPFAPNLDLDLGVKLVAP